MLGPLHKVTEIGGLAQTFGARAAKNGDTGTGRGMTLAARGYASVAGAALMAGTAGVSGGGGASEVVASGGPPNIAAALGSSARSAVAGVEGLFSQRAFNAYARAQPGLVGSLTRDLPAGSVAPGDRARIAWERTPPASQRDFAEEFLAHWLGSVDGGAAADMASSVSPTVNAAAAA